MNILEPISKRQELSLRGITERQLRGVKGVGRVTRILVGREADSQVITIAQQPGHASVQASVQDVDYHPHSISFKYRTSGEPEPIGIHEAVAILEEAQVGGGLRAGTVALEAVAKYPLPLENTY